MLNIEMEEKNQDDEEQNLLSEENDEFIRYERNMFLNLLDAMNINPPKCYLRIFDGLKESYYIEKGIMKLWGKHIPVVKFLQILERANLQVQFGTIDSRKFLNKLLIKVKESYPDGTSLSTIHEVTCKNGIGHLESECLIYNRGPYKFTPKPNMNFSFLG